MIRSLLPNTAKSARRTAILALLGVFAVVSGGTLMVQAAGAGKADFSLSGSPSSQTITRGQTATYTIGLARQNGFADAVALSASGLPPSSSASFTPNPISSTGNTSTLTIATSVGGGKTPGGTYPLTITGTGGRIQRTTTLTLVVKEPSQPNFSLSASPSSQTVLPGESSAYAVSVTRSNGFNGAVTLAATGLPTGATTSFSPNPIASNGTTSVMTIATGARTPTGSFPIEIAGTGTIDGVSQKRIATVTLIVQGGGDFGISGDLPSGIAPGRTLPLDLTLTNPNNFDLRVSSVAVALDGATSEPKCSATKHFKVTQASGDFPVVVPAGTSRKLSQLWGSTTPLPQVSMHNLPENQDICKGVSLHFQYSGSAGK